MKFKVGRNIQLYYCLVLILLVSGLATWFYTFWKSGAMDTNTIQTVFESSVNIDKLKKENQMEVIEQFVIAGKIRESINLVNSLDKIIRGMDRSVKHFSDEYEDLSESIIKSRNSLNSLLSLPNALTVLTVLKRKAGKFKKFARDNQWPTLMRISSRVYANLDSVMIKKSGYFNYYKINKIENYLRRNLKTMKKVTIGSVLSSYDKKLIIARLQGFTVEHKMLKNYLPELRKFTDAHKQLTASYRKWIKLIGPEISVAKINFQSVFRTMFFSFAGILIALVVSIIVGFLFYRRDSFASNRKIENSILGCVQDGIISSEFKLRGNYSHEFMKDMEKYHSWVKGRMSFGNIFQEGLPFPSLLLDSNLNLVWANSIFYEEWNLGEFKNRRDALNWEFLERFTNLGENDPVLEALKNNVAGIYQIQVKQEEKDSTPYEMYITPVDQGEQKRIMIFFYPLMFLEETIKDQKKSMVGPVWRSLDALLKGEFTKEFRSKVREDFNIAGIESVFGKFINLSEHLQQQKSGMINEMERIENELYDKHKLLSDIKDILEKQKSSIQSEVTDFQSTRDYIINLVELRKRTEQIYLTTINASKVMLKEQTSLYDQSMSVLENHDDNIKIFKNIISSREGFRDMIGRIGSCKSQLSQTLEQAMILTKTVNINPSNFSQALTRIKVELKAFGKEIGGFVNGMKGLDIQLSKMQIVLEDVKSPDLLEYKDKIVRTRNHIEDDTFNMGVNARQGQKIDEKIIDKMKSFYGNIKDSRDSMSQMINFLYSMEEAKDTNEDAMDENIITSFNCQNELEQENRV